MLIYALNHPSVEQYHTQSYKQLHKYTVLWYLNYVYFVLLYSYLTTHILYTFVLSLTDKSVLVGK